MMSCFQANTNKNKNQAIVTQNLIGWQHVFMGKVSGKWLTLQPHSNDNHGNKGSNCVRGASLVEASLKSYMELWEQRNKDAHSPEAHIHLAKEQASKATRKLYKLRYHATTTTREENNWKLIISTLY